MRKSNSPIAGALAAAGVIAFAAPVLADDVTLDCQVTARVESQTSDRVQTQDWGVWTIRVSAERGVVDIEEAQHFAIDGEPRLLEWIDTKAE